jgi:hypothetical protein
MHAVVWVALFACTGCLALATRGNLLAAPSAAASAVCTATPTPQNLSPLTTSWFAHAGCHTVRCEEADDRDRCWAVGQCAGLCNLPAGYGMRGVFAALEWAGVKLTVCVWWWAGS